MEARKQLKIPTPLSIELPRVHGTSLSLKFPVKVQNPEVGPTKNMPPQNTYLEKQDGDPQGHTTKDSWGKSEQGQDLLDPRKKDRKIILLPSIAEVVRDPKFIPRSSVSFSRKVHFSPDELIHLMQVWRTGLTLWDSEMWEMLIHYFRNSNRFNAQQIKTDLEDSIIKYYVAFENDPEKVKKLSVTEAQKNVMKIIFQKDLFDKNNVRVSSVNSGVGIGYRD